MNKGDDEVGEGRGPDVVVGPRSAMIDVGEGQVFWGEEG